MSTHTEKCFTVEEANATLPLVRAIVADLVGLSRNVIERQQRVEHLKGDRDLSSSDPYHEELVQIESELDKDKLRLQDYVQELRDLGVEPKSATEGLVDFPTIIDGRSVYLCWKLDEPEILHWHEREAGFAGRQPLTALSK